MNPLVFLAPAFFAAAALLVVPWIVHRIRRPEREPIRFSSLMFVPNVRREVVERRRIQHILLMLLRMLLLALLVLAFARPVLRAPAARVSGGERALRLVLVDRSYSMTEKKGNGSPFAEAIERAVDLVSSFKPEDRVGVVAFDETPQVLAPLEDPDDPEAGTAARALSALRAIEPAARGTAYLPALKLAQETLTARDDPDASDEERPRLIVHLVSDFRRAGLPDRAESWRLSPRVRLDCIDVGKDETTNRAVADLGLRRSGEADLRVLAKIKNWSDKDARAVGARLFVGEEEVERKSVEIEPGVAAQVSFSLKGAADRLIEGRVEIDGDDLALDDRRFFAWSPLRKKEILAIADDPPDGAKDWPARLFLARALPDSPDAPWRVEWTTSAAFADALAARIRRPDAVLVGDARAATPEVAGAIAAYAREGGEVFWILGADDATSAEKELLAAFGLASEGLLRKETSKLAFSLLSWIDFSHPVFVPFQGARFNDFSSVRFHNAHRLGPAAEGGAGAAIRPVARFEAESEEGAEPPAIVESRVGAGRAVVWGFGLELSATTLAKNAKFVPLLHETLAWLTGLEAPRRTWLVGEAYDGLPPEAEAVAGWRLMFPDADEESFVPAPATAGAPLASASPSGRWGRPLDRPGLVRWRPEAEGAAWTFVEAVNLRAEESDSRRMETREFELKLGSNLGDPRPADASASPALGEDYVVKREYWKIALGLLVLFLLVEGWYASRLLR